jgi:transposase
MTSYRPRDESGCLIPSEGTRSRAIYDLMRQGLNARQIGERLGFRQTIVAVWLSRLRSPSLIKLAEERAAHRVAMLRERQQQQTQRLDRENAKRAAQGEAEARKQAQKLIEYWHSQGYEGILVKIERAECNKKIGHAAFCVRSNIVNGFPPKHAVQ